jgi:hypothetical protein
MKKKSPPIVKEYATLKEQYMAEKGTLEGYEEMMLNMERQLREIAAKRTRSDGTVEPLREPEPLVVEEIVVRNDGGVVFGGKGDYGWVRGDDGQHGKADARVRCKRLAYHNEG